MDQCNGNHDLHSDAQKQPEEKSDETDLLLAQLAQAHLNISTLEAKIVELESSIQNHSELADVLKSLQELSHNQQKAIDSLTEEANIKQANFDLQITDMKMQHDDVINKYKLIEQELQTKINEMNSSQSTQLITLESELSRIKTEQEQSTTKISELDRLVSDLKTQLDQAEQSNLAKTAKCNDYQEQLKRLSDDHQRQLAQSSEEARIKSEQIIKSFSDDLQQVLEERMKLNQSNQEQIQKFNNLEKLYQTQQQTSSDKIEELEKSLKIERDNSNQKIEEQQIKQQALNQEIKKLQDLIQQYDVSMASLQTEKSSYASNIQDQTIKIQQIQSESATHLEEKQQLEQEIQIHIKEKENLNNQNHESSKKIEQMNNEYQQLNNQLNTQIQEVNLKQEYIDKLQVSINTFQLELNQLQETDKGRVQQYNQLQAQLKTQEENSLKQQSEITSLQTQNQNLTTEIEKVKLVNSQLQQQQQEIGSKDSDEILILKNQLIEIEEKLRQAELESENKNKQIEENKQQIQSLQESKDVQFEETTIVINQLEMRINEFNQQIGSLMAQIVEKQEIIEQQINLQREKETLISEAEKKEKLSQVALDETQRLLRDSQEKVDQISLRLQSLHDQSNQDLIDLNQRYVNQEQKLSEQNQIINQLKSENESKSQQLLQFEDELKNANHKYQEEQSQFKQFKDQHSRCDKVIQTQEAQINAQQEQILQVIAEGEQKSLLMRQQHETQNDALNRIIQELKVQYETIQSEAQSLQQSLLQMDIISAKCSHLEQESTKDKEQIKELQQYILSQEEDYGQQFEKQNVVIQDLMTQKEALTAQVNELNQKLEVNKPKPEAEKMVSIPVKDLLNWDKRLKELQNQNKELQNQIKQLQTDSLPLQSQVKELQNQTKQLQTENQLLKNQIDETTKLQNSKQVKNNLSLEGIQQRNQALQQILDQTTNHVQKIERELSFATQQNASLKEDLAAASKEVKDLRIIAQEKFKVEGELHDALSQMAEYKDQQRVQKQTNEKLVAAQNDLENSQSQMKQIEHLRLKLQQKYDDTYEDLMKHKKWLLEAQQDNSVKQNKLKEFEKMISSQFEEQRQLQEKLKDAISQNEDLNSQLKITQKKHMNESEHLKTEVTKIQKEFTALEEANKIMHQDLQVLREQQFRKPQDNGSISKKEKIVLESLSARVNDLELERRVLKDKLQQCQTQVDQKTTYINNLAAEISKHYPGLEDVVKIDREEKQTIQQLKSKPNIQQILEKTLVENFELREQIQFLGSELNKRK